MRACATPSPYKTSVAEFTISDSPPVMVDAHCCESVRGTAVQHHTACEFPSATVARRCTARLNVAALQTAPPTVFRGGADDDYGEGALRTCWVDVQVWPSVLVGARCRRILRPIDGLESRQQPLRRHAPLACMVD